MRTFILSFLGGLAALFFFFLLIPLAILMTVMPSDEPKEVHKAVISLDLRSDWPDQPPAGEFSAFFSELSFVEVLLRLNAAADDPNVQGVFVRAPEAGLGSSRAEELRAAFQRLQAKGKFVIAHSQGFMASGPGPYRAIATADEVWIQPGAEFEVPGISFETLFMGDALKKISVTPEIEQFFEYKNAPDVYKQDGYTAPHAEAMTRVAESVWNATINDVAADRGLEPAVVRSTLEQSPYRAEDAVKLGLADKLGWPEDALMAAALKARFGDESPADRSQSELDAAGETVIDIADYMPKPVSGAKTVVAVIGGEGAIVTGFAEGGDIFSIGEPSFASDTVAGQLIDASRDPDIDAVVFRIDSPGGSPTASDQVWRAVKRVQDSGKKVVVSMGSMAASGGYYVAAGADAIVANGSTLTGSIGVYGGKFAFADALRKIGVNPDSVGVGGEYATMYSTETLTSAQRQKLVGSLEAVYDRFTSLVADGRELPLDDVREIARGRVWTGADAQDVHLVDETGDLIDAIRKAKELAGVDPDAKAEIRLHRPEPTPLDFVKGFFTAARISAKDPSLMRALGRLSADPRAAAAARQIEAMSRPGVQAAMPEVIER